VGPRQIGLSEGVSGFDDDLDARVSELVDRGLDAYGRGDLDGAMGACAGT